MKYVFNQANQTKNGEKIFHKLITTINILPIAILLVLAVSGTLTTQRLLIQPAASTNPVIDILSPHAEDNVSGTISFSASARNYSARDYDMFWYVDNGQWNWMNTSPDNTFKQTLIDFTAWTWHQPSTSYTIGVVAVLHATGQRIYNGVPVHVVNPAATTVATSVAPATQQSSPQPTATISPTSPTQLYVNPANNAANTAAASNDPTVQRTMTKMAQAPTAVWLGSWNTNVQNDASSLVNAAAAAKQIPVMVAYNIPNRDCGGYSSGGASSPDSYRSWIQAVANGIGNHRAIVIVEPDATAQISCLSSSDLATRNQLLAFAISTLKTNPSTSVYLDAGNPTWIATTDMAGRLQAAGIDKADGFSLNVSNFISTADNIAYGNKLSALIGNKHFVVDTSRNGNGSNGEWCNPSGRALGNLPTNNTGNTLADYYLWIKTPGESDGTCNGGPAAGVWWPSYAETLAINAGW